MKWGKFEEERARLDKAREVFQTALEFFGDDEEQIEKAQAVFNAFAKMETRLKEYERARVIYKVCVSIARSRRCEGRPLSSLLFPAYPAQNRPPSMRHTQNSRSSTALAPPWSPQSSASGESNTRRNLPTMDGIMTSGSTMRVWRRALCTTRERKARRRKRRSGRRIGSVRCMSVQLPRYPRGPRSVIGGGTFSYGSSTRCLRRRRRRYVRRVRFHLGRCVLTPPSRTSTGRVKSTRRLHEWYRTSSSPLRNFGSCSQDSKYDS